MTNTATTPHPTAGSIVDVVRDGHVLIAAGRITRPSTTGCRVDYKDKWGADAATYIVWKNTSFIPAEGN